VPIDLAAVDWIYVGVLAVMVFLAALVANLITFQSRGTGALLAAILFAALFVAYTYYPHGLPLPTRLAQPAAPAAPAPPPAPAIAPTPQRPRNPVTDITPPAAQQPARNPVTDVTPPAPAR
jgi:hypothetical protein